MTSVSENEMVAATKTEAAEPVPLEPNAIYSAGDVRILIIDEDPMVGRLVCATLAGNEFRMEIVHDSKDILPALRKEHYHVIILEYNQPGLDWGDLLLKLNESQPYANLIVMTAFPIDSISEPLQTYAHQFITKPFSVEDLKKSVMRCLESRGLLRLTEDALRQKLGLAIRERRKGLDLTLSDMSKRTGISLGYLSQIELGKNSASIETLYRIALGLRIRVSELFHSIQASL
jgi:CheY-like chemotaxis protein